MSFFDPKSFGEPFHVISMMQKIKLVFSQSEESEFLRGYEIPRWPQIILLGEGK